MLNHVHKETLVKAVTAGSKTDALRRAELSAFEIHDVQAIRSVDAVVIADDEGSREEFWRPDVLKFFEGNNVPVLPFVGGREELTQFALRYAR